MYDKSKKLFLTIASPCLQRGVAFVKLRAAVSARKFANSSRADFEQVASSSRRILAHRATCTPKRVLWNLLDAQRQTERERERERDACVVVLPLEENFALAKTSRKTVEIR